MFETTLSEESALPVNLRGPAGDGGVQSYAKAYPMETEAVSQRRALRPQKPAAHEVGRELRASRTPRKAVCRVELDDVVLPRREKG